MSTRLHVGNIPSSLEEHELRAIFSRFGAVETIEIPMDSITGRRRGFAIVAMARNADADSAIRGLNFSQYGGHTIGVSKSRAKSA